MSRNCVIAALGVTLVAAALVSAGPPALLLPVTLLPPPPATNVCQPVTVALGDISGWNFNTPGFLGEDLVIRDPGFWASFWAQHSSNTQPPPQIDFTQYVVVAVVQGPQSSGGGPNIVINRVLRSGWPSPAANTPPTVTFEVIDDERPGALTIITNPYHIVAVPRTCVPPTANITFRHLAPTPGTSVLRGRVYIPANVNPWVPVAGATVRLFEVNIPQPRVAYSGLDGSYFYVNVGPGVYALDADLPPSYCGETVVVTIPPDGLVTQNFHLLPAPTPGGCQ